MSSKGIQEMQDLIINHGFKFFGDLDYIELISAQDTYGFIEKLEIPDCVIRIGSDAFQRSNNFKEIVIPKSVMEIGDEVFMWNSGVEKITVQGNPSFGKNCFFWCHNLKEIELAKGTIDIGENPIFCCENLEKITIDESDYNAFKSRYGNEEWFKFVKTLEQKNTYVPDITNLNKTKTESASERVQRMVHNINKAKEEREKSRDQRNGEQ